MLLLDEGNEEGFLWLSYCGGALGR